MYNYRKSKPSKLAVDNPCDIFKWSGRDSKQNFEKHLNNPVDRRRLNENGWTKNSFNYHTDELGFRNSPGSTPVGAILTLGCSFTYGIGLPVDSIWSTLVSEYLDIPIYNAGQPGGSSDTSFRIARELIPKYKPAIVFHLVEFKNRFEIISDIINNGDPKFIGPWDQNNTYLDRILEYFDSEYREDVNQDKNILAIIKLCDLHNILYVSIVPTADNKYPIWEIPGEIYNKSSIARDLSHPGPEWQRCVAMTMIDNYKDLKKNQPYALR